MNQHKRFFALALLICLIMARTDALSDTLIPLGLGMPFGIIKTYNDTGAEVFEKEKDEEYTETLQDGMIVQMLSVQAPRCCVFYFSDKGEQKVGYVDTDNIRQVTLAGLIYELRDPETSHYLQQYLGTGIPFYIRFQTAEDDEAADDELGNRSGEDRTINEELPAYILNKNTKKIHLPSCPSINDIYGENFEAFFGTIEEAINMGYKPCKKCNPE